MLCQFSFENFKSYKNATPFDLEAAAIPEFSESLLVYENKSKSGKQLRGTNLLPVSVIYGSNGGGKTNLLKALSCLISTVVNPIRDLRNTRENIIIQHRVGYEPFLLDEVSKTRPTEFEIFFYQGNNEYRYYLSLLNEEIVSESLYWRTIGGKRAGTVFERERSHIELGASINKTTINRSVNPKMPYLSFLAINYDIPMIAEVQSWFESCIIRNYANPNVEKTIMFSEDADFKSLIVNFLNDTGIDIVGYRLDKENNQLYTQRAVGEKVYELNYSDESDGIQKLIAVLPVLLLALKEGRLVIIDELDAKLHPKLLRYVISLFKNPKLNAKGAQLLFTSHDMTTMKNTVFRRDEIWFAAENANHESEIYSLYDIRSEDNKHINKSASFDKQYMEGRYGADPYLRNMLLGGDWT